MKRKPTLAALRRKLDKVFSLYIRRRDADEWGHGKCITCGKVSLLQCGHFIKRQHLATRWDERNADGQCVRCNLYLGGAQDVFAAQIINRYGTHVLHELLSLKRKTVKLTREDLEEKIDYFESKLELISM